MRGATADGRFGIHRRRNFNPRTPCGVRPCAITHLPFCALISIHAPHAGCDRNLPNQGRGHRDFNPRTPCGVRPATPKLETFLWIFQSTHPMRGATSPDDGRNVSGHISIHAPRAGATVIPQHLPAQTLYFNPRAPCGRDYVISTQDENLRISIHAPHAGRDFGPLIGCWKNGDFNPRAPCGARLRRGEGVQGFKRFQSTRPMRGATRG